ncbi:MAG: zinc-ribbon domain-containing protein [Ruminococcus sp.]
MKTCPKCNAQLADDAMFCTNCGASFQNPNPQPQQNVYQTNAQQTYAQPVAPVVNVYDHTAEFDPQDVHENKIFAILCYIMGIIGVIVALLARSSVKSPYLSFHIKQALKITITTVLLGFISVLLCWTCIVPIAGWVCIVILEVVSIICFFQTCFNKSVEAPIVRSLPFLK